jgi:hypothetical protein
MVRYAYGGLKIKEVGKEEVKSGEMDRSRSEKGDSLNDRWGLEKSKRTEAT